MAVPSRSFAVDQQVHHGDDIKRRKGIPPRQFLEIARDNAQAHIAFQIGADQVQVLLGQATFGAFWRLRRVQTCGGNVFPCRARRLVVAQIIYRIIRIEPLQQFKPLDLVPFSAHDMGEELARLFRRDLVTLYFAHDDVALCTDHARQYMRDTKVCRPQGELQIDDSCGQPMRPAPPLIDVATFAEMGKCLHVACPIAFGQAQAATVGCHTYEAKL
ncbi:MAG: hypothetical protein ACD_54C00177G0004 [uncultured bacterium]|nr:MAG: hypothetical protein ACD_54C00177G0004 [uncultured bacterium]